MLRRVLSAVASGSILVGRLASGDVAYGPENGLTVERSLRRVMTLELESWSCRTNGQPVPAEYLPKLELSATTEWKLDVRDEHLAAAGGKPTRMRRAFSGAEVEERTDFKLNGESMAANERGGTSKLAGCVVLFDETAAESERRKLERGECSLELLGALPIDVDLTAFLPTSSDAQAWEVESAALNLMAEDLAGVVCEFTEPEDEVHTDDAELAERWGGVWKVTRGGERKEAGFRVLELKLAGEFTTSCDMASELKDVPVASGPTTETAELKVVAQGALLWNLETRTLHAADVEATYTMLHRTVTDAKSESGVPAYDPDMNFRGTLRGTIVGTFEE
jgi:hypothetical protein